MNKHFHNVWTGKKDDKIFQKIKQACSRACRKGKTGELISLLGNNSNGVGVGGDEEGGGETPTKQVAGDDNDGMNIDDLIQVEDKREV